MSGHVREFIFLQNFLVLFFADKYIPKFFCFLVASMKHRDEK